MKDPRYARRRRAAVPAALAAFVMLMVVSGAGVPLSWAGGSPFTPAMTIVLPAQQVALPAEEVSEPASEPVPRDDGAAPAAPADDAPAEAPAEDQPADTPDEEPQPAIRHVFVVLLHQTDLVALADAAASAADPAQAPAPYLATRLLPQGTLLTGYAAVAGGSLANGIALLSGQGPTHQTLADCPAPAGAGAGGTASPPADVTPDVLGDDGQQVDADGCVYPFATGTVADQLAGAGLGWRGYVEDASGPCPIVPRDPFAYFHSLLDTGACARHVAGLDALDADLARGRDAPALLYVVPNACHDGDAAPCTPGAPAGAIAADAFLADLIPQLLGSAAYADGGLIIVTSDGPPAPPPAAPTAPAPTPTTPTTPTAPTVPTTPTVPAPPPDQTTPTTTTAVPQATIAAATTPFPAAYPNVGDAAAAGAARVGALLISPQVPQGRRADIRANHFTLLRAISDLFALQPLGYAGSADLTPLPETVLRPTGQ